MQQNPHPISKLVQDFCTVKLHGFTTSLHRTTSYCSNPALPSILAVHCNLLACFPFPFLCKILASQVQISCEIMIPSILSHTFQYSTVCEILISSHRVFPASGTAYGEVSPSVNAQSPETVYTHISSRSRLSPGIWSRFWHPAKSGSSQSYFRMLNIQS